jgi:hypothetical protein
MRHRWVGVPALVGGLLTLVFAQHAFWRGSPNLDESAYEAQASTIAHGHLTLSARTHVPFFRPFLSGVRDGRVVFKYQPVWPALMAASHSVTGSTLPLRVGLAAVSVIAVYVLSFVLFRAAGSALLAASLYALCPFLWVQASTNLGYQLSFALAMATAAALVVAARDPGRAAIVAGALFGLGVLHRPFDAIVPLVPFLLYVVVATAQQHALPRLLTRFALGVIPFALVFLAYDDAVMDAPWRMAFSSSGSIDRFGFGWRASFEVPGSGHGGQIHYTVGRAFITLVQSMGALPRFLVAAPVVLVFAVIAVWARRRDVRVWLLVGSIACVAFGYLLWWGTANAVHFGIHVTLGPFYHYAMVGPLVILAAEGLRSLKGHRLIAIVAIAAVAWIVPASALAFRNARNAGRIRANEVALLRPPGRSLVLEAPLFPSDPYLRVANDAELGGRSLVAVDVPGRELEVIRRFPTRQAYLVETFRRRGDVFGPELQRRVPATITRGRALDVRVRAAVPFDLTGRAYLSIDGRPVRLGSSGRGEIASTLSVTPEMLPQDGRVATIAAGVRFGADWYECRFEAAVTDDGQIDALSPCAAFAHYTFPNGKTAVSREDLSDVLHVDVRPR